MRKGDVATVLSYVAKRFHSEVEKLVWPGNWGYAERTIRGNSRTLSNHASGTAIDLNAPRHPLGVSPSRNFSSAQISRIHKILRDCNGVVRWGGDYNGRKDAMHFEINASSSRVRTLANQIRAGKKPGPSGGATSGGGGGGGNTYGNPKAKHEVGSRIMNLYDAGSDVNWLQRRLTKVGHKVSVDSYFGPSVQKAVKAFQKKAGLTADGDVGPATLKALRAAKVVVKDPSPAKKNPKPSTSKAPSFPLPKGHWFGVESRSSKNHSGYYAKDRAGIMQIQKKLKSRGWSISVDGIYGPGTRKVVTQFQSEKKGLTVDGAVGKFTWDAIWNRPIT